MYAGFWKRVIAVIIDSIILGVGVNLAAHVLYGPDERNAMSSLGGIIIAWLYFALMESSSAQGTLGKMAIGIKVTDLEGNRISFGRSSGRHFGKYISTIILGIGFIMAGFTEKKQALHDVLAKCLVINKNTAV